ncbi:MAG: hypothetical protein Q7R33_04845 [Nitrosarchaeum sp.]|nr:hypothetical protein [Nitrosarchaeum sp.]
MNWVILQINCDCASYRWTRRREPSPFRFLRCLYCGKKLGDMEWRFLARISAQSEFEATKKYKEGKL